MKAAAKKLIFDAVRTLRDGKPFTLFEVKLLDVAIDAALVIEPAVVALPGHRRISAKGKALIHSFESCKLATYPDPGSKDGKPVTGGWGSTVDENGKPFALGFSASQDYWDALFDRQIAGYEKAVDDLTRDVPTTQNAFDAMVCLTYNIGIGSTNMKKPGGFTRSTVLRLHRAGDYAGAARAFLMWNKNDGKVMRGLTRRRLAESDLYDDV